MSSHRSITQGALGAGLAALLVLYAAGCKQPGAKEAGEGAAPGAKTTQAAAVTPAAPVSDAPANEMGRVLVLEYHEIAPKEGRWIRTPDNLRKDLETLYQLGFRAVSMEDYVTGNINLPPGASPVVFTFDDAAPGQFRYLEKDGQLVVDPDCAVGILEEFYRKHPDFGLEATFYVLPYGFGQGKYTNQKFRYIVEKGMDLGNHTMSHTALKKLSNAKVQEELAGAQKVVQDAVPNYRFFSLALPLGIAPQEKALAHQGTWNGMQYDHRAVLLVGSTPAPSPWHQKFDAFNIPRVQATDLVEEPYQLSVQLKGMMEKENRRYVSDGDPNTITVPEALKADVAVDRLAGKQLKTR